MNFSHSLFKPETSATYTFLMRYVFFYSIRKQDVYAVWLINGHEVDPVSMVIHTLNEVKFVN
jgi:hypothetical protein